MRRLALFCLALLPALPAVAKDIAAPSTIDAVTVYLDRAQVTRRRCLR